MPVVKRVVHLFSLMAAAPLVIGPLLNPATGREYGIGLGVKLRLIARMVRNTRRIPVLSHVFEHFTVAKTILNVPRSVEGCVVECGTFAGGSTANLSLICALVGRDLEVFDSFAGLPEPDEREDVVVLGGGGGGRYHAGQFSASFDLVRENVERYGELGVCRFHRGFFDETMPGFTRPCVAAFIDVDLRGSAETCLEYLWPRLATGGRLYTHEAQELHMAALFFDEQWWQRTLDTDGPWPGGSR